MPAVSKAMRREYHRLHRLNNPDSYHRARIKYRYKTTVEEAAKLVELVKKNCQICGQAADWKKQRLCIDHDHRTGKVRGVICHSCNVTIGHVKERVEILHQMIRYLEQNNACR